MQIVAAVDRFRIESAVSCSYVGTSMLAYGVARAGHHNLRRLVGVGAGGSNDYSNQQGTALQLPDRVRPFEAPFKTFAALQWWRQQQQQHE
jgi:hypothetical protein